MLGTILYSERENHPLAFKVVCETGNYKYFAGVCRGFLKFRKRKKFQWEHYWKIVEFFNGRDKSIHHKGH
jgi:hypothetical protein